MHEIVRQKVPVDLVGSGPFGGEDELDRFVVMVQEVIGTGHLEMVANLALHRHN
jgi:hypothetical protein